MRFAAVGFLALLLLLVSFVSYRVENALSNSLYEDHSLSGPRDEGEEAFYRHDWMAALKLWQPLADQGNPAAQNNIGVLYERGLGVKKDWAEAFKWFRQAADKGNSRAEWAVGAMYLNGWGAQHDPAKFNPIEAEQWFRKSAEHGDAYAEISLANVYDRGFGGIEQDDAEALKWYRKAADHGLNPGAENAIARIYEREQKFSEAAKWWRQSGDRGDGQAEITLGDYYRHGKGVTQDWAEAYYWYKVGVHNGALAGDSPHEVDAYWGSLSIQQHLTPEQILAVSRRASEWKPSSAQAPTQAQAKTK